ncbi:hypothetical protein [Bradyrhizobium sp. NAS80.1]|uniref:hypothetical protein n=1 Tax=Bradyrhizobium sp. NAS80.1 TaxID=1680159 RepID=UPI00143DE666|nr:hypothetical protein [Bradyrhizobium sp. NAS80.1]
MEKINDGRVTVQAVQAGLILYARLVWLREEFRARKDTVASAKRKVRKQALQRGGAI